MAPSRHPLQEGNFDPLAMLRQVRGDGSDTRAIRLRMLWLRQREPSAQISTEMVRLEERVVVMGASVTLPDGAEGTGHAAAGIENDTDLAATIEATELRAIGKALDALGYVVLDSHITEHEPERPRPEPAHDRPDEAPAPQEAARGEPPDHVRAIRSIRDREQRQATPASEPGPDAPDTEPRPMRREPAPQPSRPAPTNDDAEQITPRRIDEPSQQASDDSSEPALEDVSWTAFWNWARETYQLRSRVQLEELLGQPVGNKAPGELRRLLIEHYAGADGG